MAIIYNNKIFKLAVVIFICVFFAVAIFFLKENPDTKKTEIKEESRIEKFFDDKKVEFTFKQDVIIDEISDLRGLGYSGQRKIVQDSNGNIFVAYRKEIDNYFEIFVAKISEEEGETKISGIEKPIAKIGKTEQRVPSIAVDKDGIVHVVWYGADEGKEYNNRQIKYARSIDKGKTWSQWKNIAYVSEFNPSEEYWQEHPFILSGHHGSIYVVWEGKDKNNSQQQIKFIKSADGGISWSQWKNIKETVGKTQSRPSLVENKKGELFVIMYSSGGNEFKQQQIQAAMSKDEGETWTDWQTISDPKFDSRHASSAIDSKGIVHVVWRSQTMENENSKIFYRNFNEYELSDIEVVSDSNGYQFFPSIGVFKSEEKENIFVSWMESAGSFDFPRENPQNGTGFISFFENGHFQKARNWGEGKIFYPNVPKEWQGNNVTPVLYTEKKDNYFLNIKLRFFNGI